MIRGTPIGLPQIAAMMLGMLAFVIALLVARARVGPEDRGGTTRSQRSRIGIFVQGIGIACAALGIQRVTLDPMSGRALAYAAIVAVLMTACVALFVWSTRTMGRNWSIVARTRSDHGLVTTGPFAIVRHPIYGALFLLMLALAIAFGHLANLIVAIPLFALGTWLRIGEEERLLRAMFGGDYDRYARRVPRFVPGVF